jgi:hypothetical protein
MIVNLSELSPGEKDGLLLSLQEEWKKIDGKNAEITKANTDNPSLQLALIEKPNVQIWADLEFKKYCSDFNSKFPGIIAAKCIEQVTAQPQKLDEVKTILGVGDVLSAEIQAQLNGM